MKPSKQKCAHNEHEQYKEREKCENREKKILYWGSNNLRLLLWHWTIKLKVLTLTKWGILKEVGALCDTLQIHFFLQQTLYPPVRHLVWLHQNLYLNIYAQYCTHMTRCTRIQSEIKEKTTKKFKQFNFWMKFKLESTMVILP